MTAQLPPNLLQLFTPRVPVRFIPPSDHPPEDRRTATITGVAAFLPQFQEYIKTDEHKPTESWLQRHDRLKLEKKERQQKLLSDVPSVYKPSEDPNIRGDAFKTLIVARLSYEASEKDLESEFGRFGPIERIRIVVDTHQNEEPNKKEKKHRGYAFVVYEREKDMRAALDGCDGIVIKGRRIKVDVQRSLTVKGWKPRRFGGGLGGRGYTKAAAPRSMAPGGFGGPPGPNGFGGRGGFRGGFDGGRGRGGFSRGGGGFDRGGYGGGGRGGIGFGGRGGGNFGAPPLNAPAGPGGRGGFSGGRGGYGGPPDRGPPSGGYDRRPPYEDRNGGGYRGGDRTYGSGPPRAGSGSNMEPVRPRDGGSRDGGYRDRDASRDGGRDGGYRPRDDDSRKRPYESNGNEDPRKLRRY